ncbi:MAG: hypothetical protein HYT31_02915 [Parcubacteria group bacterium]|nr:hypothetical protein [Parcubacteria group bacterium]
MNQQQRGGQGRRNRNRGGGGQGGNALNIPGVPQQVIRNALDQIEVGELGDEILDHLQADGRRAEERHRADIAKMAAETDRVKVETEAKRATDARAAEKDRKEAESASKASRQKANFLVAQALSEYLASINGITALAELHRRRITVQFLDKLTPAALEHFRASLGQMAQEGAENTSDKIQKILALLGKTESDTERFRIACALGLLPEQYQRS